MSEIKRIQGMVRSIDQWLNMVPSVVATGSMAQVEYALVDAKTDIEALWLKVAALSSAAVAEREPVAQLYDWTDDDGETQTDASTQSVKSVNFQPVHNVRPLYLDPPPTSELEAENARLRKEQDALIEAAVIAERESCAFAVECHSGFGDPETIEACAQIVRDRCDPALRSDSIHLTPERYAELEAAENRLAEALKALEKKDAALDAIIAAFSVAYLGCEPPSGVEIEVIELARAARRVREGGKVDG